MVSVFYSFWKNSKLSFPVVFRLHCIHFQDGNVLWTFLIHNQQWSVGINIYIIFLPLHILISNSKIPKIIFWSDSHRKKLQTYLPPCNYCRRSRPRRPTSHIILLSCTKFWIFTKKFHFQRSQEHVNSNSHYQRWLKFTITSLTVVDCKEIRSIEFVDF